MARFQSTRPIRGATTARLLRRWAADISIHAPHTGRDNKQAPKSSTMQLFQSTRPIRGATIQGITLAGVLFDISIHAPHTGRDFNLSAKPDALPISIHAPHTGRDVRWCNAPTSQHNFNPRAPYGARLGGIWAVLLLCHISIHAPHTGRDKWFNGEEHDNGYFNPRAPYGARRQRGANYLAYAQFQSTRPIRGATAKMHNLCSAFLQQQTIKA